MKNIDSQIKPKLEIPFIITTTVRSLLFLLFIIFAVITSRSPIWLTFFLVFFFYEIGVYSYTFHENEIILKYFYLRKKVIRKDQITRIVIKKSFIGDKIEIDWKKSPRHSTRIIKIPMSWFRKKDLKDDETIEFLKSIYL
jgi:hypothetical protein